METARKRMMQAVPEADVVITNPTHLAAAIKYDSSVMNAPKLLAKGSGKMTKYPSRNGVSDVLLTKAPMPICRFCFHDCLLCDGFGTLV